MAWQDDLRSRFPDWQTEADQARWPGVKAALQVGSAVAGEVVSRAPFGVWLDIGVAFPALLMVTNMHGAKLRRILFVDYPAIGTRIEGTINTLGNRGEIGIAESDGIGLTKP